MAIWQRILLEQHNQTSLMFIKGKKRITNGDFIGALIISMPSITERAVRAKELHTNAGKEHVHRFLRLLQ
jgi:hypothetical protein